MAEQPLDPRDVAGPGLHQHPVAVFADRLNTRLDDLSGTSFLSMSEVEKRETLTGLMVALAKLEALSSCSCSSYSPWRVC